MYKYKTIICVLIGLSLLIGLPAFATDSLNEKVATEKEITSEPKLNETTEEVMDEFITIDSATGEKVVLQRPAETDTSINEDDFAENPAENDGDMELMSTSSSLQEAYLVVDTNCYAAPCPTNGYLLHAVPVNTWLWVVEKVYCSHNNRYYYYAGYNYNGESHRGYFNEDNVYMPSKTRLLPANVPNEKAPANYKVHTSLAGTVYDGPGNTYSQMGSVGSESIKLIRTDNDYNFIEYSVTGTNKVKRGFLHYSLITGNWGVLTAANKNLDGQVLYICHEIFDKRLLTISSSANKTYSTLGSFTGQTSQLYKFTYVNDASLGPYFYIQPVIGYDNTDDETNTNRRLEIEAVSGSARDGRRLESYTVNSDRRQKFWVVQSTLPGFYKIVPLNSYGTMTLHAKSNSPADVTQSYTIDMYYNEDGNATYNAQDMWRLLPSSKKTSSTNFAELKDNWCWAVSGHIAASAETPFDTTVTQREAVMAARDDNTPDLGDADSGGSIYDTAQVANYFMNRNINSNYFAAYVNKIYSQTNLRKFIFDDHSVVTCFRDVSQADQGHMVTFVAFRWSDRQGKDGAPGYYQYGFYCPDRYPSITYINYTTMTNASYEVTEYASKWKHTAVYQTNYASNTITVS